MSSSSSAIRKSQSESKLSAFQSDTNLNVTWLNGPFSWVAILGLIVGVRIVVYYFMPFLSDENQWTFVNLLHAGFSFWAFHWNRGTPFWDDGENIDKTVWEQIDNGVPWTDTRKFLMIVPIVLFLVTCHATNYDIIHLSVNFIAMIILLIAKIPEMHGVRLLHINEARVD